MSDKRLPFILFEGALDRVSSAVKGGTSLARSMMGRDDDPRPSDETAAQAPSSEQSPAEAAAPSSPDLPQEPVLDGAASAAALATALDDQARAALARHAPDTDDALAVTEGLQVDHDDSQPAPAREGDRMNPRPD